MRNGTLIAFALFLPGTSLLSGVLAFVFTALHRKGQALFVGAVAVVTMFSCMIFSLLRPLIPLESTLGDVWYWVVVAVYGGAGTALLSQRRILWQWARRLGTFEAVASSPEFAAGFQTGLVLAGLWLLASAALVVAAALSPV